MVTPVITGSTSVCANGDENYSTSTNADDYVWSINSGSAGSIKSGQHSKNIVVEWNNYIGTAWLVLQEFACNTSIKDSILINITHPPVPPITSPPTTCQGATTTFSSSGASSYAWNFGDAGTGSGSPVTHVYSSPGSYTITLTATYTGRMCGNSNKHWSYHSIS